MKKLTELEAVKVIHEALEPFDVLGRAKVLRAVTSILEVDSSSASIANSFASHPHAGTSAQPASSASQIHQSSPAGNQITPQTRIDAFVSAKRPNTTYQRLACLAYYLEHHDQVTELTGKVLNQANASARQPKISSVSVFLTDATNKYGFFASVGGGKKTLTARGSAVVEALPDQAAVKQVLEDHPGPRRGGKRAKGKANK